MALAFCLAPAQAQDVFRKRNYRVRIAVAHEVEQLAIQGNAAYQVVDAGGEPKTQIKANQPYFVQITRGRPGAATYRLILKVMDPHQTELAIQEAKAARTKYQLPVKVFRIPMRQPEENRILVTLGEFSSQEGARKYYSEHLKKNGGPSDEDSPDVKFIYEDRTPAKEGQVRLVGGDGTILARDPRSLRVVPLAVGDESLAVAGLNGNASQVNLNKARHYRGEIELAINEEGTLTAVNDLWIEYYLYAVVPAEIGSDAPMESLKAQAVAARSEAVAKIQNGIVSSSFFDFYDTSIAQVYRGRQEEVDRARQAVDATRGEILIHNGLAVDAVYSHSCGGLLCSSKDLWDTPDSEYSVTKSDRLLDRTAIDLSSDEAAAKWLSHATDALCNPEQAGYPKHTTNYYRWTKTFTGSQLSDMADRSYGTGQVKDISVTRRMPSGRVREIKIQGEKRTVRIHRELEIRSALDDIYSTFFALDCEKDAKGFVSQLTVHGAGFGHGVGLCQMGAFVMGKQGYNYRQILAHYFQGVKIRRLYQ